VGGDAAETKRRDRRPPADPREQTKEAIGECKRQVSGLRRTGVVGFLGVGSCCLARMGTSARLSLGLVIGAAAWRMGN